MPTPTEVTGIDAPLPESTSASDGLSTPAPVTLPALPPTAASPLPIPPPIDYGPNPFPAGANTLAPMSITPGPVPAPMQPVATSTPTWVYVVGGVAVLGIVGLVIWLATRSGTSSLPAATEGRRNPLPRSRRRRGRR